MATNETVIGIVDQSGLVDIQELQVLSAEDAGRSIDPIHEFLALISLPEAVKSSLAKSLLPFFTSKSPLRTAYNSPSFISLITRAKKQ